MIRLFLIDERGATAIEYGLIAALISITIITALGLLGDSLDETFTATATAVAAAIP
jgi:pilus assembly protein Flp/PilA